MDENGEETNKDELHFFYDSQSRPAFVEYNEKMYRYIHNLQGDIVGIVDAEGTLVVEYKYDAWGKSVSITGSMASTLGTVNPFRYRGYVWDKETKLYYLRARYYSSSFNRFINADVVAEEFKSVLLPNLFCYCLNNPIILEDTSGLSAAVSLGIGVLVAAVALVVLGAVIVTGIVQEAAETVEDTHPRGLRALIAAIGIASIISSAKQQRKAKRNRSTTEKHHIVAKLSLHADPARKVLNYYGINVWTDPDNLVVIPRDRHKHLHTKIYYTHVNTQVVYAGFLGEEAVRATLKSLRDQILFGVIPF